MNTTLLIYLDNNNRLNITSFAPCPNFDEVVNEHLAKNKNNIKEWKIVTSDELPDPEFRLAWTLQNGHVIVDIEKAKEIWYNKFRTARKSILEKLDVDYIRALEQNDQIKIQAIVRKKQQLRDLTQLDLPNSPEELKKVWPSVLE